MRIDYSSGDGMVNVCTSNCTLSTATDANAIPDANAIGKVENWRACGRFIYLIHRSAGKEVTDGGGGDRNANC